MDKPVFFDLKPENDRVGLILFITVNRMDSFHGNSRCPPVNGR
jgi:hypothetical protein